MILISVDLPAPFSPISAWISPGANVERDVVERPDAREDLADVFDGELHRRRPSGADGAPAVEPDRREDQRAEQELHPIGIDLGEHQPFWISAMTSTASMAPRIET